MILFVEKLIKKSFYTAKASHTYRLISEINIPNLMKTLTNDIDSFEQSGPEIKPYFYEAQGYKKISCSTKHEIFPAHSSILSLSESENAQMLDIFILISI